MVKMRFLFTLMIPVFSHAMEQTQDSPRKSRSLTGSTSSIQSPRLDRSGSIAKVAVAQATLRRVATSEKLRKSGSNGFIAPQNSTEASLRVSSDTGDNTSVDSPSQKKLVDLRDSLRRSKSPLEDGEADLVVNHGRLKVVPVARDAGFINSDMSESEEVIADFFGE